ncbi:uncharacterized protein LOC124362581 isoform X2 [Homalodisca vitripennis]|uniref:uncharacterized protein LOC124362581 isoform X2 n=1 Tax=Homalodisca vitripennis TaxID=197043 RepID=UPI001EE9FF4F|nr:uncharacterized protein LOC124362581 isoform X2 [Homalodisca vitripennis]
MADCVLVERSSVCEDVLVNGNDILLGSASEDSSNTIDSVKSGFFVLSESDALCSNFQLNGVKLGSCSGLDGRVMGSDTEEFTAALKSIGEENGHNCRKKRCADRYDSSESSDSGVATLSCTDCSGSSSGTSDITEPGSPFSTSSHSESDPETCSPGKMPPTQSADTTAWPWSAEERDRGPPHTPRYFLTTPATKRVNNNTLEDCVRSKCCKVSLQQGKITEYFKAQLKPQKKCDTKIQLSSCDVAHKKLAVHISGTVVPVATKLPLVFQQQKTTLKSELANKVADNSVVTKVNRVTPPPLLLRKSLNSSHELSPVPVTPVFRKPNSVLKCSSLPCAPEVSVLVPKPKTPSVDSAQHTACSTPNPPSPSNTTTSPLSVSTSEHCSDKPSLPSPILRTPSVIRFPARNGWKGHFLSDIVCRWSECEEYFSTTSALLEHLQAKHVNTQSLSETFVCLWNGCKVYDRASCSRSWLERHVLSHGGNKPFRCIVDGCGQRFSSQIMLERHVNQHFNQTENSSSSGASSKRNLESTPNKLFRRNGKKLRYRRQPFSARMFDYIDTGIMEGVQHSLLTVAKRQALGQLDSCSSKSLTLHSKIIGRRIAEDGTTNVLLRWFPLNVMNDEWVPQSEVRQTQQVPWKQCQDLYRPPLFRQRSTHHQRKQSATR